MSNKFQPGESGNPDGRPVGSKDKRTQYRELFEPHADALIQKVINLALDGDTTCLKMCIDRIVSPFRSKNATVILDDIEGTLTEKGEKIINAMGKGELSPSDASSMLSALAAQARIIEIIDLEERISKLEAKNGS